MRTLLKVTCLLEGGGATLLPACFEDDDGGMLW